MMKLKGSGSESGEMVGACIRDFFDGSREHSLNNRESEKAWTDFLVGFSRGDGPLHEEFKDHIGPFSWTPSKILRISCPESRVAPGLLTVISWILQQTEKTKSDNRKETRHPSERWARAYACCEELNRRLRKYVVATLKDWGYEAVAPMLSPLRKQTSSERHGSASNGSERHASYASGREPLAPVTV